MENITFRRKGEHLRPVADLVIGVYVQAREQRDFLQDLDQGTHPSIPGTNHPTSPV
jgi:hypothetical protein